MKVQQWIAARRARNRFLAEQDAKRRCAACKRELPQTGVWMRWEGTQRYCSVECLADAEARERVTAEGRF